MQPICAVQLSVCGAPNGYVAAQIETRFQCCADVSFRNRGVIGSHSQRTTAFHPSRPRHLTAQQGLSANCSEWRGRDRARSARWLISQHQSRGAACRPLPCSGRAAAKWAKPNFALLLQSWMLQVVSGNKIYSFAMAPFSNTHCA